MKLVRYVSLLASHALLPWTRACFYNPSTPLLRSRGGPFAIARPLHSTTDLRFVCSSHNLLQAELHSSRGSSITVSGLWLKRTARDVRGKPQYD